MRLRLGLDEVMQVGLGVKGEAGWVQTGWEALSIFPGRILQTEKTAEPSAQTEGDYRLLLLEIIMSHNYIY